MAIVIRRLAATREREYELVLMLDPELPDDGREKIASDARGRIEAAGELRHDESWGLRKLAYDIGRRTEADYRFYRFRGERGLLDDLDHNLKIADGVLRFRIFKVDPGAPLIAPPDPSAVAARGRREGGRGERRGGPPRGEAPDAPEAEAAVEPEAEPAPEAPPAAEAEPEAEAPPAVEAEPAAKAAPEPEAAPETEPAPEPPPEAPAEPSDEQPSE